jgi:DMSO/TMAO reductase YedYZ molybdopterin-dependent catalytic subunit
MITISKVILSGAAPGQIRDQTSGLASAPLRDLAAELAADPDLTVQPHWFARVFPDDIWPFEPG